MNKDFMLPKFRTLMNHLSWPAMVLGFVFSLGLICPGSVVAEAPVIREVIFEGLTTSEQNRARRELKSRVGEQLEPEKTRADLRALYDAGFFGPDLVVETRPTSDGGVQLVFRGQTVASVGAIEIVGNSGLTNRRITSSIPIKVGDRATAARTERARSAIDELYRKSGFADVAVSLQEMSTSDGKVTVRFVIDEGSRIQIRNLRFSGNRAFLSQRLSFQIRTKPTRGPLRRYLNETLLEEDLTTLREFYGARGYLDAQVEVQRVSVSADPEIVDLNFQIEEGPRYRVATVTGSGFTIFSPEEVLGPFTKLQGQTYSQLLFSGALRKVRDLYGNEGFLAASIEPEFRRREEPGLVDVHVFVSEGPRITVGEVKVVAEVFDEQEGGTALGRWYGRISPPVQDEVIRREVRLKPGQVYRRLDEVKTRDRLQGLGIFEQVEVRSQLTESPSVRDAVVQVREGNTGSLLFGVGFGDVEGAFGYATYAEKNLFGLARDLRASVLIGSSLTGWEISYLDRYFLGSDRSALFSVYQRNAARTGRLRQTSLGTAAEFTRPLDERLRESVRFRLENIEFRERGRQARSDVRPKDYLAATMRYRLLADTRDTAFLPNEGILAGGGVELGMARDFLVKLDTRIQKWVPLSDDWNYQIDLMAGFIPFDAENIGYAERFFMGGANDLRGFRLYGAGPHDGRNTSLPIGGSWKLLARQELRYRFTENLAAVGFFDAGTLSDQVLNIDSPRASIGTGLRMRLPVATIGLDLGIPLLTQKRDQTQFFHFTLNSGI
jgi:outer membrane protein insertion porin family